MKFNKLTISNFLTIQSAELALNDRGLLLIQGVNSADSSAKSNGAGKSSVVDALCWALYGETARGVSGDAVVNNVAKKDCCVKVELQDGDMRYRITRWRKGTSTKNSLTVWQIDPTGAELDLSKGTDKETQEVINKVVGCGLDVFAAAVYAGQERMPDLPGMTDKFLKMLIEEASGTEILAEAHAVAKAHSNEHQQKLADLASAVGLLERQEVDQLATITTTEAAVTAFESDRRNRAKAELARTLPLEASIKEAEDLIKSHPSKEAIQKEMAELDKKWESRGEQEEQHEAAVKKAQAAKNELTTWMTRIDSAKNALKIAERELEEIDKQIGTPCDECGKVYTADDMKTAKELKQKRIEDIKNDMRALITSARTAKESADGLQESADKLRANMTSLDGVAAQHRALNDILLNINTLTGRIESEQRQIAYIKGVAAEKLVEKNPWQAVLIDNKAKLATTQKALQEKREEFAARETVAAIAADAVKVFGPAGVRAHILDTVTPFLNERTRDYLGTLADGNIQAVWSTLSKTAKGELREKFSIDATNGRGADSFAGLSGGEKRKVRLATALALQDLVASRATKPIDLWIGDEIDHALDTAGLERLMSILEKKARDHGTVLVISHSDLKDWCDNVITVEKHANNVSTVTGDVYGTGATF